MTTRTENGARYIQRLQTAIGNWLNRGDPAAAIPDFITVAQSQMLKRFKKALNEGKMLPGAMICDNNSFTIPEGAEFVALPSDLIGVVSFRIDSPANPANAPQVQFDYISPMNLAYLKRKRGPTASNDTPSVYTILGNQFQFSPLPISCRRPVGLAAIHAAGHGAGWRQLDFAEPSGRSSLWRADRRGALSDE
jgi:hypothetical protein